MPITLILRNDMGALAKSGVKSRFFRTVYNLIHTKLTQKTNQKNLHDSEDSGLLPVLFIWAKFSYTLTFQYPAARLESWCWLWFLLLSIPVDCTPAAADFIRKEGFQRTKCVVQKSCKWLSKHLLDMYDIHATGFDTGFFTNVDYGETSMSLNSMNANMLNIVPVILQSLWLWNYILDCLVQNVMSHTGCTIAISLNEVRVTI